MGLTAWNAPGDPYDHTQLANNFTKIDVHDHSPGKGLPISAAGIGNGTITTAKIADGAVTTAKIANNAVTAAKMDRAYVHPLGSMLIWYRPNGSLAVPTGWVIMSGQTLAPADHDFPGGGSILLPNPDQDFIKLVTSLGSIGSTGGSSTVSLAHSHTVSGHQHTIAGHSHVVPSHVHYIIGNTDQKEAKTAHAAAGSSFWVAGDNPSNNGHIHGIELYSSPGSPAPFDTSSVGLTTNSASGTTNSQLGSANITPPFTGFLPLLKVKL